MSNKAVLLINLGSPDSTKVSDVRRYLAQFLMDERVIDAPFLIRFLLIYLLILPTRPKESAKAYATIWTDEGSPLIVHTQKLANAVKQQVDIPLDIAMRYGQPSIEEGLKRVLNQCNNQIDTLYAAPLYPHYAMSSYETVVVEIKNTLKKLNIQTDLQLLPPFYDQPEYIDCLSTSIAPYIDKPYDHLLFSYHGLPVRHLKKSDPTGSHCQQTMDCCNTPSKAHKTCYLHQSIVTTQKVVETLKFTTKWSIAYQSRLGRDPWITPNTEDELIRFAQQGKKKMLIVCPSFVSDCLETLEEIEIRADELFQEHGGEKVTLIPCLNENQDWVNTLSKWINTDGFFVKEPIEKKEAIYS